jgi:pseudouridylate synthase
MRNALTLSPEVRAALTDGMPVVALESTVIAHGLPHPDNLETSQAMEQAVRDAGAVPATIAVVDGRIRVGLSEEDRAHLADPKADVAKLSRRDIAACVVVGGTGATTVSATMICAQAAGIEVFATGGIGGVHRGAVETMDISADLLELSRTPVLTIASGAKKHSGSAQDAGISGNTGRAGSGISDRYLTGVPQP